MFRRVLTVFKQGSHSVTNVKTRVIPSSVFLGKMIEFSYEQNGQTITRDVMLGKDSVSVLLYNSDRDSFVFVNQFRAAVYFHNNVNGITHELCAGIIDKKKSAIEIIQDEIFEECGYTVDTSRIEHINSYYAAVGSIGAKQELFYCKVSDRDIVNGKGGGLESEGEYISLAYVPKGEILKWCHDEKVVKTASLLYAVSWFLLNKNV
jgi:UDP-sugar diphosphatase